MARFGIVLVSIVLAGVCSAEKPDAEVQILETDIQVVDDITAYRAQHPGADLVPLDGEVQRLGQIKYTLGQRVAGDRIVAQGSNSFTYPTLQDVRLNLNYPQGGIGSVVSYVEIIVDQSSNDGNAHIVSGGIGQRRIGILVEARRTQHFSYRAAIFGY